MPVWTHPPWVLFKLNYPANLNTQAAWRISKFIGGSSAIVDVDFIFGALKQGINSSRVTCPQAASERNQKSDVALESAGSLYYLSCYIPPVRASCYIEFSSVLALNVQSICSSLGHETCRWVWGRGFHAVWKPKYYESKPRIFVPRQIEVQRKVEVEGGGGKSAKPVAWSKNQT